MTGFQWFVLAIFIAMDVASYLAGSRTGVAIYTASAIIFSAMANRK